jgi:hypothetical protein
MANEQWKMENRSARHTVLRSALHFLIAAILGFGGVFLFRRIFPDKSSFHLVPASLTIDLLGIAVLLALLPQWSDTDAGGRSRLFFAWLKTSLLGAVAFVAMWLAPWHAEPGRTFAVLTALFCGQCAMLTGIYGLLLVLFSSYARLIMLLILGGVTTALIWSAGIIRIAQHSSSEYGSNQADTGANAVLRLSPPAAIACAWKVEGNAGRHRLPCYEINGGFGYKYWVANTVWLVLPQILPSGLRSDNSTGGNFDPGLSLAMLAFGVPMMLLCDFLLRRQRTF